MKILFVCTGNTCRSPMAEAMARNMLAEKGIEGVSVRSAGLCAHPGTPMSHDAAMELERRGLPFFRTRSARLTYDLMEDALVLCMSDWQLPQIKKLGNPALADTITHYAGLSGEVADPFGGGEYAYRRAADQIQMALEIIIEKIQEGNALC